MSANILTMLKDFETGNYTVEQVAHAIGYSPAGDSLDYNDWRVLYTCNSKEEVVDVVKTILPKYEKASAFLGNPKNHDEWIFAMVKDDTEKHKEYLKIFEENSFSFERIYRVK